MRALQERNLKLTDIQQMLPMLRTGPVGSILNMVAPQMVDKLEHLGKDLLTQGVLPNGSDTPTSPVANMPKTAGNPFPPLKPR